MVDERDPSNKLQKAATNLVPEIVEASTDEGGAQININILLQQIAERTEDPDKVTQHFKTIIDLSKQYEEHRLEVFRARTQALIDAKKNDPDEIEKRLNNLTRRKLKGVIGACAIAGIAGALVTVIIGSGIVVTGLLGIVGVVAIAMSGPLASGESISSRDVVRMVRAVGDALGKTTPSHDDQSSQNDRKRE